LTGGFGDVLGHHAELLSRGSGGGSADGGGVAHELIPHDGDDFSCDDDGGDLVVAGEDGGQARPELGLGLGVDPPVWSP